VPFCIRRCGYCAFTTYAESVGGDDAVHRRWAEAAVAEVALADRSLGPDRPPLTSVYFGGGTPTAVDPGLLVSVLDEVRRRFDLAVDLEVSVESNPDGLRDGQLEALRDAGANRVSFGLQSVVPRVLALLDRTHDPELALAAVGRARAAGVDHVSLDLMHGTPGERPGDWSATLDAALGTGIDHLSAYALAVEPGTKLAARVRAGELAEPSGDEQADRYLEMDRRCAEAGFDWYELSNWSRTEGARCRHNLLYWRDHHWWGVGPGAHSHVGGLRWWNARGLDRWWGPLAEGASPAEGSERVDDDGRRLERLMLGIRLAEGLPVDAVADGDELRSLREDGLLRTDRDRVVLTRRGRLLADLVVRRLSR
jgi:oxygen-independent coproporphyrinogen-3 oxidase